VPSLRSRASAHGDRFAPCESAALRTPIRRRASNQFSVFSYPDSAGSSCCVELSCAEPSVRSVLAESRGLMRFAPQHFAGAQTAPIDRTSRMVHNDSPSRAGENTQLLGRAATSLARAPSRRELCSTRIVFDGHGRTFEHGPVWNRVPFGRRLFGLHFLRPSGAAETPAASLCRTTFAKQTCRVTNRALDRFSTNAMSPARD